MCCVQIDPGLLLSFRMIEQQRQVHSLECLANIQLMCKQCASCYNGICMLQLHKVYDTHVMCLLNEGKFPEQKYRLIPANNWLLAMHIILDNTFVSPELQIMKRIICDHMNG